MIKKKNSFVDTANYFLEGSSFGYDGEDASVDDVGGSTSNIPSKVKELLLAKIVKQFGRNVDAEDINIHNVTIDNDKQFDFDAIVMDRDGQEYRVYGSDGFKWTRFPDNFALDSDLYGRGGKIEIEPIEPESFEDEEVDEGCHSKKVVEEEEVPEEETPVEECNTKERTMRMKTVANYAESIIVAAKENKKLQESLLKNFKVERLDAVAVKFSKGMEKPETQKAIKTIYENLKKFGTIPEMVEEEPDVEDSKELATEAVNSDTFEYIYDSFLNGDMEPITDEIKDTTAFARFVSWVVNVAKASDETISEIVRTLASKNI